MHLSQLGIADWTDAVLLAQDLELSLGVDRERVGAGFDQRDFGGLVLAEEEDLLECLGVHHDEGELEQGEEPLFVTPDEISELWRALRNDLQFVSVHFNLVPAPAGFQEKIDGGRRHMTVGPASGGSGGGGPSLAGLDEVIFCLLGLSTSTEPGPFPS
jgi:hypothetical protein